MTIREAASRTTRKAIAAAARNLRQRQTPSERLLWDALRDRRLHGRKFRRQARIGHVVVDFYCPAEQFVIEVDGGIHFQQPVHDHERQQALEEMGLTVLRVTAQACEQDPDGVLQQILSAFRPDVNSLPSPSERERGQG